MRRVRVAQIGTNRYSHAASVLKSMRKQSDVFEVVGYALPEGERERFPERMADFEGLQELTVQQILNDPTIEAVAVETEEVYLTKYAALAAQHGKHIHMEKPGGIAVEDFREMMAAVKQGGRVFHTGYMYRYNPAVVALLQRVERGDFGDIICVEAQMSCYHTEEVRRWLKVFPGGMMFFLGCHLVDLVYRIMGKPEQVIPLNRSVIGGDACDYGMAVLMYPKGASFVKASAAEIAGFSRRQLVVTGTKMTAEICPLEVFGDPDMLYTEVVYSRSTGWADRGDVKRTEQYERYDSMMASFAAMVRGEKQNPYSYDYEAELYELLLQCCKGEEQ